MFNRSTGRKGNSRNRSRTAVRHRVSPEFERLEYRTLLAAGDLDTSFGDGGFAPAQFPNTTSNAVAIEPNGDIVVAGQFIAPQGQNNGVAVAVYDPDGTLDPNFGDGGTEVIYPTIGGAAIDANIYGLAIQPDGKIVAVGYTNDDTTPNDKFLVLRINPDGTLDSTFGINGEVEADFTASSSGFSDGIAYAVALQPNGDIVAVGTALDSSGDSQGVAARFEPNGSLDPTFGSAGEEVVFDFGKAYSVALQATGTILVGGIATLTDPSDPEFSSVGSIVVRLFANGGLDPTFGSLVANRFGYYEPSVYDPTPFDDDVRGLAVQANGDFVAVGHAFEGGPNIFRSTADGLADDGSVSKDPPFQNSEISLNPTAIANDPSGKIVVAGGYKNNSSGDQGFFVERFNSDGSTDSEFGAAGSGIVLTSTGGQGTGVALQPDGAIDVTGQFETGNSQSFALVQYQGGPQTAPPGGLTEQPGTNITVASGVDNAKPFVLYDQVEGQIAINPTDPDNIAFVGANEGIPYGQGIQVDIWNDDGVTSQIIGTGAAPDNLPSAAGNDATIAFDQFGNLFIAYLTATTYQVNIVVSTDGGASFHELSQLGTGNASDQPKIRTGPGGTSAPGSVWVEWADTGPGQLVYAAGAPVQGLGQVGTFNTEQVPGSGGGDFGDIAVGPAGQVVVTYENDTESGVNPAGPGKIWVNLDANGLGGPFGDPILVTSTNVGMLDTIPAQSVGINAEPKLAWDRSGGPFNGRLYLVYTNAASITSTGTNIYVLTSDNDGMTWSSPVLVNNDLNVPSQFDPTISLDQTTGFVAVCWYGNAQAGSTYSKFYGSVSANGGESFTLNATISDEASNPSDAQSTNAAGWPPLGYGDYSGSDFYAGRLLPVWSDDSFGVDFGTNSFDIDTDQIIVEPLSNVEFSAAAYVVNEAAGTVSITVDRIGDTSVPASVNYATSDGSGTAGTNYTTTIGTLSFPVGATSESFSVPIIDDLSSAGNATINLTLSDPKGGASLGLTTNAVLTILTQALTPQIAWNTPSAIIYGTALSSKQLDATAAALGASVAGTFTYNPPLGTVLSAGTAQSLSVTFTPTDTADYSSASATVTINVTQAMSTINWSNPADITYGAALTSAQLDATASALGASVAGTFTYTPPLGTVLHAGTAQDLSVTFTPTDSTDYSSPSATVMINVNQAMPTINWSNPADITAGTALGGTQLDAVASVPGTFTYSIPAGTVLGVGSGQSLSVLFTPSDTTDYQTVSAQVAINVLAPLSPTSTPMSPTPTPTPTPTPPYVTPVISHRHQHRHQPRHRHRHRPHHTPRRS